VCEKNLFKADSGKSVLLHDRNVYIGIYFLVYEKLLNQNIILGTNLDSFNIKKNLFEFLKKLIKIRI